MRPVQRRVLSSVALVLLTALWGRSAGAQTTERVSVVSGGTEGNNASLGSALSADGRFVAFDSAAADLVAGGTNSVSDVFVHDRQTGGSERVSVAAGGAQGDGSSGLVTFAFPPALSADGRFVAFVSFATNLVASDTNGATDVFVHDRQTGTTERVSVASDGTEGNAASAGATLSADGRFVAFHSAATNLVAGDTNGTNDVFVHDRQTGITERVSVASDGTQGNKASSYPALSADGRFVAFDSDATNLVAGDTNGTTDVFVHDRQTGTTERVSGASDGTQGNDASAGPALSADGRLVAFHSSATNLVAGDANRAYDVFVHDRAVSTTTTSTTQPATTSTTSTTTTTSTSTTWPPTTTSSAPSTTSLPTTTISTTTVTMPPTTLSTVPTTTVTMAPSTTVTTSTTPTATTATTTTTTTPPTTTATTPTTTTLTTATTTTVTTAPPTTVTTAPPTTVTTAPTTTVTTASTTTVTTASTTTVTTASTTTVTTASTTTVTPPTTTTVTTASTTTTTT